MKNLTKTYLKDLIYRVNGAAIEVHKSLGAGLLESVYHQCLAHEMTLRNISFISEMKVPVLYKNIETATEFRCDFFVEDALVVEIKSLENVLPIHEAQLLTYMKLLNIPEGLMINFNVVNIYKEGQRTYVNELYRDLPN